MRQTGLLIALALGAIGCASPQGGSLVPTLAPPVLDPAEFGLTCGDDLTFHPALLAGSGGAETDPDPGAEALRAWLAGPEGAGFPRSGWIRVAETPAKVQFLAPDASGDLRVLGFFVNQGAWALDLAGTCIPQIKLPDGVNRATLRLDPAFPAPAAADREVHLLITETACASGQSPEGRVLPPFVNATPDGVWIAVLVTRRPGSQECPGNPEFPITVDLTEPLGDRPLFDPTLYPAAPIGEVPAGARARPVPPGRIA